MLRVIVFIYFFCILSQQLHAQLDNHAFENSRKIGEGERNNMYLEFDMLGFVKNNEYFNDIVDGYTLFGYQFSPRIVFYPEDNVRIDAGVFLRKDFGREEYYSFVPTFSIKIKQNNWKIIFGNLEGNLNHQLIEPLYDFERALDDPLETGLQAILEKDNLFLDAWIDWETMIYKGDNFQEELSGGLSVDYKMVSNSTLSVSLPIQAVLYHKGGQIDNVDAPLTSLMNNSVGIKAKFPVNEEGFLKAINTEHHYVGYTDFSSEKRNAYNNGRGIYLNLGLDFKWLTLLTSYWQGSEFISIKGAPLYQSVSYTYKQPEHTERERKLLIFRFLYDRNIFNKFYLSLRFEPHLDLKNEKFEFSHGLYINYRPDFYLFKVKNKKK